MSGTGGPAVDEVWWVKIGDDPRLARAVILSMSDKVITISTRPPEHFLVGKAWTTATYRREDVEMVERIKEK